MSTSMTLRSDDARRISVPHRTAGLASVVLAVVLVRLPFRVVMSVLSGLKRICTQPASPNDAVLAVAAADVGGRWLPCRVACLERSVAAVIVSVLVARRNVEFCIGVRLHPYSSHAWIAVGGEPIGEPNDRDRPYLTLLQL